MGEPQTFYSDVARNSQNALGIREQGLIMAGHYVGTQGRRLLQRAQAPLGRPTCERARAAPIMSMAPFACMPSSAHSRPCWIMRADTGHGGIRYSQVPWLPPNASPDPFLA